MKLTNLEPASDFEVQQWFEKAVEMTRYQKEKFHDNEVIRFSKYSFYKKRQREKVSFLWRLTLLVLPIYWLGIVIGLPITFLINGKWGYSQKFFDNFHSVWMNKLNL